MFLTLSNFKLGKLGCLAWKDIYLSKGKLYFLSLCVYEVKTSFNVQKEEGWCFLPCTTFFSSRDTYSKQKYMYGDD